MFASNNQSKVFKKRMLFVTGAPRSGTSLLTKVLDAHKDIALLMENNFGNRRRHWEKSKEWDSSKSFSKKVSRAYASFEEPVIGNKICTPDVWWSEDIKQFCNLFEEYKVVFIVRDPVDVVKSRYFREDFDTEFNEEARRKMLLDFRTQFLTYTSSWRQSIDVFRQLRDTVNSNITCVYYEDFVQDFERECRRLTDFLGLPFDSGMLKWSEFPHHDHKGNLKRNMKYIDISVDKYEKSRTDIPESLIEQYNQAIASIEDYISPWRLRRL